MLSLIFYHPSAAVVRYHRVSSTVVISHAPLHPHLLHVSAAEGGWHWGRVGRKRGVEGMSIDLDGLGNLIPSVCCRGPLSSRLLHRRDLACAAASTPSACLCCRGWLALGQGRGVVGCGGNVHPLKCSRSSSTIRLLPWSAIIASPPQS